MFQPEGKVFFGSAGEVDNPQLAIAILHRAVVRFILEKKAAIFHGKSSLRGQGRHGLGTDSSASSERALWCPFWPMALTA